MGAGVSAGQTGRLTAGEVRQVQLGVLAEFDRLCRGHGLTYYLAYGTLLGAVRHAGFIPWDDDIDVMMPRADYDRLHDLFETVAAPHLSLGSPQTRAGWPFAYAKIGDDRTELWEALADPLLLAVNVDVFPVDAVPSQPLVRALQNRVLRLLRWAVELRYVDPVRALGWHRPAAVAIAKPLLRLVPVSGLVGAFTRAARMGRLAGARVGVRVGSYDWTVCADALGTPGELPFEDLRLLAPAAPDQVLAAIYGNYRQLPPVAEQVSEHLFTAAWRATPLPERVLHGRASEGQASSWAASVSGVNQPGPALGTSRSSPWGRAAASAALARRLFRSRAPQSTTAGTLTRAAGPAASIGRTWSRSASTWSGRAKRSTVLAGNSRSAAAGRDSSTGDRAT